MKTLFTLLLSVVGLSLNAQLLLEENFTYDANIEAGGAWTVAKNTSWQGGNAPTIYDESPLVYNGYDGSGQIKSAYFTGNSGRISHRQFSSEGINSGTLYAAFITKIIDPVGLYDFFMFANKDGAPTSKVFATVDQGKVKFGTTITDVADLTYSDLYEKGETCLLVLKYTFVEGEKNDSVALFVNPVPGVPEFSQISTRFLAAHPSKKGSADSGAVYGIAIRQRGTSGYIGGIRVGKTWEDIMSDSQGTNLQEFANIPPRVVVQQGVITVENEVISSIKVYNLLGRLEKQGNGSSLSVSDLPKGSYVINIETSKGEKVVEKITL